MTKLPPPLILDDEGREIDPLTGKPKEQPAPAAQAPGLAAQQLEQQQKAAAEAAEK